MSAETKFLDLTRGDTPERSSDLLVNLYKEIPIHLAREA